MRQSLTSTSKTSHYSVHPSVAYAQAIINNLTDKTGKSIDQWVRLVRTEGPEGDKERRDWLKLGGTTAWLIAGRAGGNRSEGTDGEVYLKAAGDYVDAMYAGPKAPLRPIHDALIELGRSLGEDVRVCPCKTIVPLYRQHVFAEIKPATRKRIDFGLALDGSAKKPIKRLMETGGLAKGDRITHRFTLTSIEEIDSEVKQWLKIAYDLDA